MYIYVNVYHDAMKLNDSDYYFSRGFRSEEEARICRARPEYTPLTFIQCQRIYIPDGEWKDD